MRKIYLIILIKFLTVSFSVYSESNRALYKIDSLMTKGNRVEALKAIDYYVLEKQSVSKSLIFNALHLSSSQNDTASVLKYHALGVKYFPNDFSVQKLNNISDSFDNDRYFGSFSDWFVNFHQKHGGYFHSIILFFLFLSFVIALFLKLKHKKGFNLLFVISIIFGLLLFWSSNRNVFHHYKQYYVYDSSKELRLDPSYISDISIDGVKTGELMAVDHVSDVWVAVVYNGKKYYVSKSDDPFIF